MKQFKHNLWKVLKQYLLKKRRDEDYLNSSLDLYELEKRMRKIENQRTYKFF